METEAVLIREKIVLPVLRIANAAAQRRHAMPLASVCRVAPPIVRGKIAAAMVAAVVAELVAAQRRHAMLLVSVWRVTIVRSFASRVVCLNLRKTVGPTLGSVALTTTAVPTF